MGGPAPRVPGRASHSGRAGAGPSARDAAGTLGAHAARLPTRRALLLRRVLPVGARGSFSPWQQACVAELALDGARRSASSAAARMLEPASRAGWWMKNEETINLRSAPSQLSLAHSRVGASRWCLIAVARRGARPVSCDRAAPRTLRGEHRRRVREHRHRVRALRLELRAFACARRRASRAIACATSSACARSSRARSV